MQRLGFGTIENVVVRAGQPVMEPPSRVVKQYKFGCECGPRREVELDDFELCRRSVHFVSALEQIEEVLVVLTKT